MTDIKPVNFYLGQIVATRNLLRVISHHDCLTALARHAKGDWGDVDPEDGKLNDDALQAGDRLFSVYHSSQKLKFWIITESDRSVTTILLPEDY